MSENSNVTILKPAAQAGHNLLTRDVFHIHLGRISKVEASIKALQKIKKQHRRDAMDAGIVLEDLDDQVRQREDEPETVMARFKRRAQYAEWMGQAPGVQGDLFVAAAKSEDEIKAAENEGYVEGLEGETAKGDRYETSNPIGRARLKGWNKGQDVLKRHFEQLSEARKAAKKGEKKPKAKAPEAKKKAEPKEADPEMPAHLRRTAETVN